MKRNPAIFWSVARILVGVILAFAGWAKLTEPIVNFEAALLRYGVFSPQWIPWMAKVLPWCEWLLGCFLVVGYLPRLAAAGTGLLSLGFLVTLGSSEIFLDAGNADCGCFGNSFLHLSVRQVFFLDLINFAIALRLAGLDRFPWSLHSFLLKEGKKGADKIGQMKIVQWLVPMLLLAGGTASADGATKLSRGLSNTACGWFEVLNEIGRESDQHGLWIGVPSGLVRGSALTLVRTLAGIYEVVTFPFPNGKKGYEPIVLPESVFERGGSQ